MEEIIIQYLPTGLTAVLSLVIGIITKILTKRVTNLMTVTKDQKNKEIKENQNTPRGNKYTVIWGYKHNCCIAHTMARIRHENPVLDFLRRLLPRLLYCR